LTAASIFRLRWRAKSSQTSSTDNLTDREIEILERIGKGEEVKGIASALNLSPKTVETHRAHIKEKLKLTNARQVARYAVQWVSARGL
jgi:DNA-binding NarL/FixJ family response regulator